ncbi:hypothetical protein PYW08_006001 [Mythimna loreyi]|uniref:Uncharacterized protein n=1 Tax=Mythimna loreyi TaxID=667449 RepID=A0ACC2QLT3_9NEOP|nr:hypothetical protein PYW08_006001 [Mythimna loreyi]
MAEKSISYVEASKLVPVPSRNYANAAKTQTYRKTVAQKPKSHAPLSPSYDKVAHHQIVSSPQPSQPNGCALNNNNTSSNDTVSIIKLLIKLLPTISLLSLPTTNYRPTFPIN